MANTPITLDRFGGLDLRRDLTELGLSNASASVNVDFEGGQPRRRFGTRVFNAVAPEDGYAGSYTETPQYSSMAVVGGTPPAPASAGPEDPGTLAASTEIFGATGTWTNPSNAATANGSSAQFAEAGTTGKLLKATNFGFAIPSDATVTGIKVDVRCQSAFGETGACLIVKGGTTQTPPPGSLAGTPWESFTLPVPLTYITRGSSSSLWTNTWTPADVNASDFGVSVYSSAAGAAPSIDHIRITVHYTPATPEGDVFAVWKDDDEFIVDRLDMIGVRQGRSTDDAGGWGNASEGSGESIRFARIGTAAASYLFAAVGPGNDSQLLRWDGSGWSVGGFTGVAPEGSCVAVTPWDNRLVNGGGADGTWDHQVVFSDEGAPLTIPTDNTILLHPGDSERIVEIVTWENFVFAFKQTQFFVFYGVSTDSTGGPVFEYRAVTGEGCSASVGQKKHVAVARDAVYFVNERGVFATRGGDPSLVSRQIDAMFRGGSTLNPYTTVERSTPDGLWYAHGRLYLAFEGRQDLFVYDIAEGWWSTYDLPGGEVFDVVEDRISGSSRTLFSVAEPDIHEMREDLTLDGAADEAQGVLAGGGIAGNFTLVFDDGVTSDTTASIAYNATAAAVQTALEGLSNIDAGEVECFGGDLPDNWVFVKFLGDLAETDLATMTIGTENVTGGNAQVSADRDGVTGTPIPCTWISGASDLGYDADKVVKELYVTAQDGTVKAGLSTELGDFPTGESKAFSGTQTLRYRGAATNVKGRLIALKLENSTATEDASAFNPQRLTINQLGSRGGPQEGSE